MSRDQPAPAPTVGQSWVAHARERWIAGRARFGPRTTDLVLMVGTLTICVVQLLGDASGSFPIGRTGAWLVMPVSILALWWRRRWPLTVTLFGCAIFAASNLPLTMLIGLTALAIRRRDRVLAVTTLAVYTVSVGQPVIVQHSSLGSQLLGCLFLIGSFLAFGAYVGARRDLVASLRDRADRAESERELRAEQARLGERARIAQEMHDVLAHKVSLIALHAGALELSPDAGADQVERSAVLIRSTARQALEDLRGVLGVLRSDATADGAVLAPQPKLSDVRRLVDASREAGVAVDLVTEGDAAALCDPEADGDQTRSAAMVPEQLGRTAYRVVQEGLTNVHKHARGAAATVRLSGQRGGTLQVSVTNLRPVSSGSLLPGAGAGLVGLRERVGLAGGTLTSGRETDGGWSLSAALPWPLVNA
jgi:signal transduction histidine kinase